MFVGVNMLESVANWDGAVSYDSQDLYKPLQIMNLKISRVSCIPDA